MSWTEQLRSANWSQAGLTVLAAYALGCFTTGYYLFRMRNGGDVRDLGSGSVGARNVGRMLGWMGFLVTVVGDFAKGAFAVWASRHFTDDHRLVELALLAVVAGHIWPVQLRFRGGKGAATALGALLVYDYHLAFYYVILFAVGYSLIQKTVLPGLAAFALLPFVCLFTTHDHSNTIVTSILAIVIWLAHRKNLMSEVTSLVARRDSQLNPPRTES